MKKVLLKSFLICSLFAFCISCSNNSNNSNVPSELIGTWYSLDKDEYEVLNFTKNRLITDDDFTGKEEWIIKVTGKRIEYADPDDEDFEGKLLLCRSYIISGDVLTFTGGLYDGQSFKQKGTKQKGTKNNDRATSVQKDQILLLERITFDNGMYEEYTYDDQNSLTHVSDHDKKGELLGDEGLIYEGTDLVGGSRGTYTGDYEKSENRIVVSGGMGFGDAVYHLNNDGYIIKYESDNPIEYTYDKNGNKTKEISDDGNIILYEYDNKKSPFIYSNTPKWWMQTIGFDTKNNVIKITKNGKVVSEYTYEYNNSGYPTKCTEYSNGKKVKTSTYKYKNAIQPISNSRK